MNQMKVLLAEDEVLNRLGVKVLLENLGFKYILEAADGEEAIEMYTKFQPDLLIFDINMPNKDGLTAIKEIYKEKRVPAIITSAYHDEHLIKHASEIGINYYLIKPIDEKNLKIAIELSLSKSKQYKNLEDELNQLKESLNNRIYIEKAKGILMKNHNISEPEAMKKLQKLSTTKNIKLVEVAKHIISAEEIKFI